MATMSKYQDFIEQVGLKQHNLNTDQFNAWLSNVAPTNTDTSYPGTATEIASGNGYTTGGEDIQNTWAEAGGTGTMSAVDVTWTCVTAPMATFRYVGLYNLTHGTDAVGPGFYDYTSGVTLQVGETFKLDFVTSLLTMA